MGDDRQFDEAHAAVTRADATFVSEIESMFAKWEDVVAPELPRDCRRLFGLSYAAMAACSSMA